MLTYEFGKLRSLHSSDTGFICKSPGDIPFFNARQSKPVIIGNVSPTAINLVLQKYEDSHFNEPIIPTVVY